MLTINAENVSLVEIITGFAGAGQLRRRRKVFRGRGTVAN
jgi:hypothetical protein